jgi:hypothetical protein
MVCYFVAYLDRTNVGFAALQMNKALRLTEAQFGFGAGLFFVTYCLCEVPSNLLLFRFGARRWIARIMFSWGLCAIGMALIANHAAYYSVRALLGAAEAGFQPGVLFFITLWIPEAYRGRVLGLFFAAIPLSGIIGAPISGFLLSLDGFGGLAGWRWLYILEGLPALMLAPVVLSDVASAGGTDVAGCGTCRADEGERRTSQLFVPTYADRSEGVVLCPDLFLQCLPQQCDCDLPAANRQELRRIESADWLYRGHSQPGGAGCGDLVWPPVRPQGRALRPCGVRQPGWRRGAAGFGAAA